MKKRGKGIKINLKINFTNRWLYTFIAIGILAIIGIGVYALSPGVAPNPGHLITDVAPPSGCSANQFLQWTGAAWTCATATDPAVMSWAKTNTPNIPGSVTTPSLTATTGYVGTGLYGWCAEAPSGCQSSSETVAPGIGSGPAVCNAGNKCACLGDYAKEVTGTSIGGYGTTTYYSCYKRIL